MMIELMLVEGVSDVQLISYFLQNVYGWKYEKSNKLGIAPHDKYEHIESLSQNGNQLVLCGVGGNGKFAHFVEQHRVNDMIVERDISSLMVVTDRDEDSDAKIGRIINNSLENISIKAGQWINNSITDSFGQSKNIHTERESRKCPKDNGTDRQTDCSCANLPAFLQHGARGCKGGL